MSNKQVPNQPHPNQIQGHDIEIVETPGGGTMIKVDGKIMLTVGYQIQRNPGMHQSVLTLSIPIKNLNQQRLITPVAGRLAQAQ